MLSSYFTWQQIGKQCKEDCSHTSGAFSTLNSQQEPMLSSCTVLTHQLRGTGDDGHKKDLAQPQHDKEKVRSRVNTYISQKLMGLLPVTLDAYSETVMKEHWIFLMENMKQKLFIPGASLLWSASSYCHHQSSHDHTLRKPCEGSFKHIGGLSTTA